MKTTLAMHIQSNLPHLVPFIPAVGNGLSERYREDYGELAPKVETIEEGETMMVNEYPVSWLEAQPIEEIFEAWRSRHLAKQEKRKRYQSVAEMKEEDSRGVYNINSSKPKKSKAVAQ